MTLATLLGCGTRLVGLLGEESVAKESLRGPSLKLWLLSHSIHGVHYRLEMSVYILLILLMISIYTNQFGTKVSSAAASFWPNVSVLPLPIGRSTRKPSERDK